MEENTPQEFYRQLTSGTKSYKEVDLEADGGYTLTNVKMHPVDKKTFAGVVERLPEAMFEAAEDMDADVDPEEVDDQVDDMSAVTEETVEAFEDLLVASLSHEKLTSGQMEDIVAALDFQTLFTLGAQVMDMSVEQTGAIRDFHERD